MRAGAMLLGVAYHAAWAWVPDIGRWYFVADASPVPALTLLVGLLHAFRMQLFFALSGFFSHLVLERRGPRGFLVDRSRRLLAPFAAALPVVVALEWLARREARVRGLMAADFAQQDALAPGPVHLWFLVYLFAFCGLAWLAARRWRGAPAWLAHPLLAVAAFALPTALGLWLHPENKPEARYWPQPFEALHYGLFFAFGWLLWPQRERLARYRAWGGPLLAAGLALGLVVFSGPLQWRPAGHALSALVAWLVTVGALGLAFRFPPGERPWLRFLVESAYWVYLAHFPVVLGLHLLFVQVAAPGLLEYAATVALTLAVTAVSFARLVRPTRLGPWLGVRRAGGGAPSPRGPGPAPT